MEWENKNINVKCVSVNLYYPYSNKISAETKELIEELWLEKISLAGIASVTKVSKKWR